MESLSINQLYPDISKKFIRTVGDKIQFSEVKGGLVLPYEHIIQNICDYLVKKKGITPSDQLALSNILDVKSNKFSFLSNLNLDADPLLIAEELSYLKDFNCEFILDATTQKNGQNLKALREVSKLIHTKICFGFTFKEDLLDNLTKNNSNFDFKKVHSDLRYELTYGFEEFIPACLGEFLLSRSFPSETEKKVFDVLIKLCVEFGVPILVKLNHFITEPDFAQGFQSFFGKEIPEEYPEFVNRKKLTFVYSNDNIEGFEKKLLQQSSQAQKELAFLQENVLKHGYSLVFALQDCDLALVRDYKQNTLNQELSVNELFNLDDTFSTEKFKFILELLRSSNYLDQIMLSNNISFKCQLKRFGGFGYAELFKRYMDIICKYAELDERSKMKVFRDNLINLICWWEPPKLSEKTVKTITCQFCKNAFPETNEHFDKMDFVYCSIKCMQDHRKNNYQ